ncbi:MAG: thioesterase [Acidobacteriia bacterium]|nr:thioesterase [Terriglobia bacterium]
MPKPVPPGARAEIEETVTHELTLTAHHPELPPVYSTPDMVRLMETACFYALQPYAEGDEITVGTAIHVTHTAPTGIGAKVKAEAVLESLNGRFYTMRVRAWMSNGSGGWQEIGSGTVDRAFVSVGKFLARMSKKS